MLSYYTISGSRHHLTVEQPQSSSDVCPAMHDYEYVHYPCLVDGGRTPPATPIGESNQHNLSR